MKYLKILLIWMPLFICAENLVPDDGDKECVQNHIKQEYNNKVDTLFAQEREIMEGQGDFVAWLYQKNKEEFKDIKNLMSDISIETCFDGNNANIIKKELRECLKKKLPDEIEKVADIKEVTAENVQDFFHLSRIICSLTQESQASGDECDCMIRSLEKENRLYLKNLKIREKAINKMRELERRGKKEKEIKQLRERIILGAYPR